MCCRQRRNLRPALPLGDTLGEWMGEITGHVAVKSVEVFARDAERERELDSRIFPGIPSGMQIFYLCAVALGVLSLVGLAALVVAFVAAGEPGGIRWPGGLLRGARGPLARVHYDFPARRRHSCVRLDLHSGAARRYHRAVPRLWVAAEPASRSRAPERLPAFKLLATEGALAIMASTRN